MNGTILNLGPLEVLVVIILALLVLGPERLPGIMRGIGTGLRKLRETYVAFVSEFRNELQPIAEEVDTVTREIQGELAAIREAADIRSVLNPVAQDLTDAANLKAPSSQPPVNAPAWGIGTEPTADGGRQTADGRRQFSARGTVNQKVVPAPSVLTTQMRPPCASTMWRAMASPRPVPLRPRARSTL